MISFLRIRPERPKGYEYPYSVGKFRADEPRLTMSSDPHLGELASYAALRPPILLYPVTEVTPPNIDDRTERLLPVEAELTDGTWRQVWTVRNATEDEIAEYDAASQPPPDFVAFGDALLNENGFESVWSAVLQVKPMLATAMTAFLETFRTQGDWSQYLNSLGKAIVLLETDAERQHILSELIGLSQRCHLPSNFIEALQTLPLPPPE